MDFHDTVVDESKWQAVRHGLQAAVLPPTGILPAREAVGQTLERIAPHAEQLGAGRALAGIERILDAGNSAERQRAVFEAERQDVRSVVAALAAESESAATAPTAA